MWKMEEDGKETKGGCYPGMFQEEGDPVDQTCSQETGERTVTDGACVDVRDKVE